MKLDKNALLIILIIIVAILIIILNTRLILNRVTTTFLKDTTHPDATPEYVLSPETFSTSSSTSPLTGRMRNFTGWTTKFIKTGESGGTNQYEQTTALYEAGYMAGKEARLDSTCLTKHTEEGISHKAAITKTYSLGAGKYIVITSDGRATGTSTPSQTLSGYDSKTDLYSASALSTNDANYNAMNNLYVSIITMNSTKNLTINFNASNHSSSGCVFIGKIKRSR